MVLNRNRVRSYTFSEFRVEYDKKDMVLVDKLLENIKTNKVLSFEINIPREFMRNL